jgi:HK97 family phage major capsid protein
MAGTRLWDLRKKREDAIQKADAVVTMAEKDGKRALTSTEQVAVDACLALAKTLTAEIQPIEKQNTLLSMVGKDGIPKWWHNPDAGTSPAPGNRSIKSLLREAMQTATAEEREQVASLATYLHTGMTASADLTPGGDGGFLIPTFVHSVIERNYSQVDAVRSVARRFPTQDGADFVFPVLSDSESAEQVASAASTGADDVVSGDTPPTDLTGPTLHSYKVSSKPVFLPRETSTDSVPDIVQEVIGALLARIIRWENAKFTSGTGSGQQEGFLHGATPFEESGGVLSLDAALDLAYSVPALYRPQGVFMCSDATAKYLRKLKTGISGDKTQLWGDGNHTLGTPSTLHGWAVVINPAMDDVSADGTYSGKNVLAFGDFSKFLIREAENNTPYLYRYPVPAKDGVGVIAFRRTDSKLLVPEAISKLTVGGS